MTHVFDDPPHPAHSDTSPTKDLCCIFRSFATRTRHKSRQHIESPRNKGEIPPTVLRGRSGQQACPTVLHMTSIMSITVSTRDYNGKIRLKTNMIHLVCDILDPGLTCLNAFDHGGKPGPYDSLRIKWLPKCNALIRPPGINGQRGL